MSGELLLETAKMHGLNGFKLKRMYSEEEGDNVPSTSSNLLLENRTPIRFPIKRTKRLNSSSPLNEAEEAEQNHFKDKQMNEIQDEEINNISSSLRRLFRATIIQTPGNQNNTPGNQENTPENQENTPENQENIPENQENSPEKENESDFMFLKPKIYRCYCCHKQFFNNTIRRRHAIPHISKLHWCSICKRGYISKIWYKKHKFICSKLRHKFVM